ncbi:molybdopterin cofactor-binding domain-containing protein, partial [Sinorhizobium fredii]
AGGAIWAAADTIIERLKEHATARLEAHRSEIVFEHGIYRVDGRNRAVSFAQIMAEQAGPVSAETFVSNEGATFPNGCHICEVEVDPETGHVELVAYSVVDDVGHMVNPLLVKGQITGGVAQGLGQALMENASMIRIPASFSRRLSWTTPCRGPLICRVSRSSAIRSRPDRTRSA